MSDNPLETTPERTAAIEARAKALFEAAGHTGDMADYRERADELVRMEMAGAIAQLPIESPDRVDEAAIQENLGEFPGSSVADQGEWRETPMTRDQLRHRDEQGGVEEQPRRAEER